MILVIPGIHKPQVDGVALLKLEILHGLLRHQDAIRCRGEPI